MNNDNELIEFYKWLSERAIIDDCYRVEGEAECAVKLYNKSKVKNLTIPRVSQQRELLKAFQDYYQNGDFNDEMSFDSNIDNFLEAFNCG